MSYNPVKPKVDEYNPPYKRGKCSSGLRLTTFEERYVSETPSIKWWWEDVILPADHGVNECSYSYRDKAFKGETHARNCHPDFPDSSKKNTWCGLASGHEGPHMAEIGICEEDLGKDIWISWKTGEHDSRELKQPGMCKAEKEPNHSELFCILAEGHGGPHCINDGFVGENWELMK